MLVHCFLTILFKVKRKKCGCLLLESIQTRTANIILRPRKCSVTVHCRSQFLRCFVRNPFSTWKQRVVPSDVIGDVYDGEMWKTFKGCDQNTFTDHPFNFMLFLNVDWFQPFTHVQYSVGANLPRSERHKFSNVILCGIIPGPNEPKHTMNQYLSHLVAELKQFWNGVEIEIPHYTLKKAIVKVALTGVSSNKKGLWLSRTLSNVWLFKMYGTLSTA